MMLQYMRSKTGRCILLRENNGITILLELTDFKIMGYDLYGDYFEGKALAVRKIFLFSSVLWYNFEKETIIKSIRSIM